MSRQDKESNWNKTRRRFKTEPLNTFALITQNLNKRTKIQFGKLWSLERREGRRGGGSRG